MTRPLAERFQTTPLEAYTSAVTKNTSLNPPVVSTTDPTNKFATIPAMTPNVLVLQVRVVSRYAHSLRAQHHRQ